MTDNRAVFAKYEDKYVLMHIVRDRVMHLYVYNELDGMDIGTVINCRVDHQIENIGASFVQYEQRSTGYMNKKYPNGSVIPLMYKKEGINNKKPLFSDVISIEGEYIVVSNGPVYVKTSSKIPQDMRQPFIDEFTDRANVDRVGVIIRTSAYIEECRMDQIHAEYESIVAKLKEISKKSSHVKQYSILYRPLPAYIKDIIYLVREGIEEVVTDEPDIMDKLTAVYDSVSGPVTLTDRVGLRLYEDDLIELSKLYSFNSRISECLSRKVYLKSGAYITFDETEALTAIDVNTASNDRSISKNDTFLSVNLEAASEIIRQLIIRNIGGIVVIDFINMGSEDDYEKLAGHIKLAARADREYCRFVDFTGLKLCELVRSRHGKSLYMNMRRI